MNGILGLLALSFVVLKLAEVGMVATWSWWLVLSPAIAWVVLVTGVALCAIVVQARNR